MAERSAPREEEPGRKGLWLGILAYRWASLAWMTVLALRVGDLRRPELGWAAIGATAAWVAWFTVSRGWQRPASRFFDLGLAAALLLVTGLVMQRGDVVGDHPFFAAAYPLASILTWAAAREIKGGILSALALSIPFALSRPLNGTGFAELSPGQLTAILNGVVYYLLAGGAVGLVARTLRRAAEELRRANEEVARERDRAARLAERESLARQIHDSVLQALAMVHKRGKELGAQTAVPGRDVLGLAEMAAQQERTLRSMIQRGPEEPPQGTASLRDALEDAAGDADVPVTVTAIGPIWLPAHEADELAAAVRQALENVGMHASASKASVFAEEEDGHVVVSVRDDGVGFSYDEERMLAEGKLGILKSMKGRIEDLGGSMRLDTAPGKGTEVEFRVPVHPGGVTG